MSRYKYPHTHTHIRKHTLAYADNHDSLYILYIDKQFNNPRKGVYKGYLSPITMTYQNHSRSNDPIYRFRNLL